MKKILRVVFLLVISIGVALSFSSKTSQAAAYGAKLYTTPRAMRGTWYLKRTQLQEYTNISNKYLTPYKKFKITKHAITFTSRTGHSLEGNYTLYAVPNKKFSSKQMVKAENYATEHKWLAPYSTTKHSFSFSEYWLHIFQGTSNGDFKLSKNKKRSTLQFITVYEKDYFVKNRK